MTVFEILKDAAELLKLSGETDTPRLDAEVMLAEILECDRFSLIINPKKSVPEEARERFLSCVKRRQTGEPVAYILGCKEFMSLKFFVSDGVLIPRPDTEILAEFAIDAAKKIKNPKVLDLCTGSGALAVAVLKYAENAFAYAVDFSEKCVETAEKNAAENGVAKRIKVIKQDILKDFSLPEKADILVSNPPYIKTGVIGGLLKTVKDFEPVSALDGGGDGLLFYKRIIEIAPSLLKKDGILAFEIGFDQGEEVPELLKSDGNFEDIYIIKDFGGRDRVVTAKMKN